MAYEVVIGLEAHAQLLTASKMFCGCGTAFGAAPNTQTCPVCLGMPGVLPVINRKAVDFAIRRDLGSPAGEHLLLDRRLAEGFMSKPIAGDNGPADPLPRFASRMP